MVGTSLWWADSSTPVSSQPVVMSATRRVRGTSTDRSHPTQIRRNPVSTVTQTHQPAPLTSEGRRGAVSMTKDKPRVVSVLKDGVTCRCFPVSP